MSPEQQAIIQALLAGNPIPKSVPLEMRAGPEMQMDNAFLGDMLSRKAKNAQILDGELSKPQFRNPAERQMNAQMERELNAYYPRRPFDWGAPVQKSSPSIMSPEGYGAYKEGALGAQRTFAPGQGVKMAQDMTPEQLAAALAQLQESDPDAYAQVMGGVRGLNTEEGRSTSTPKSGEGIAYVPDNSPGNQTGLREVFIPSEVRDQQNQRAQGNAEIATRTISNALDYTLGALDTGAGGAWGALERVAPWTDSAELYRQNEVLGAQARIKNLQAMREASPTGGALGQVSDSEGKMLEAASGALDPRSPNYERDVLNYARNLYGVVHGAQAGDALFFQQYGDRAAKVGISQGTVSGAGVGVQPDGDGWITLPNGMRVREKK